MATCAACLGAIREPEKFVIMGTEVLHRACATQGVRTQGQRHKQRIADLEAQIAGHERRIGDLEREARQVVKARVASAREFVRVSNDCGRLRQELAEAQDALVRAEARHAAERTPAPSVAPPPTSNAPPPAERASEPEDATAIRMSLLDLS